MNGCSAGSNSSTDYIVFDQSLNNSTITINNPAGALPGITSDIIINDSSLDPVVNLSIDGDNTHRIFELTNGSDLTVNNLALTNGYSKASGGAVSSINSSLTINNSTISGNSTGSYGGGIYAADYSTTTINNSTISGNSSGTESYGGGLYASNSTMTINNSTISGNSAGRSGGGISSASYATLTLTNSIVSGNTSNVVGSELENFNGSIISTNSVLGSSAITTAQALYSFTPDSTNIILTSDGGNPHALNQILAPLTNNGGATPTHGVVPNSPALNAGDNSTCLATDQRGELRANDISDPCDIGAFEGTVSEQETQKETLFVIPLPNDKSVIFSL